jgi:hypothetical protein
LLSIVGATFGAIDPPCIACGKTVGPFLGGIIGVIDFGVKFGLPAAAGGFVVGSIGSCFWRGHGNGPRDRYDGSLPEDQAFWVKPSSEQVKRFEG